MMILYEYLLCFIYVSSLFFCCYPYLKIKKTTLSLFIFLLIYAFVDFVITGNYIIDLQQYFIANLFVIISDYILISIYQRKLSLYILFYTSLYFCIYTLFVNIVMFVCTYCGITLIEVYQTLVLRTILSCIYSVGTVIIYKGLEKVKIIPKLNIIIVNPWLFDLINIIVLLVYLIFFGMKLINLDNALMKVIFLFFICLWLILLYLSNKSIFLMIENNKLEIVNLYQENTEQFIKNYKKEIEETRKIKHDMKGHLAILQSMTNVNEIKEYICSILTDIENTSGYKFSTGNNIIDIVLELKEKQYPHLQYKYNINFKEINMEMKDLASILCNLIDNASQHITDNDKVVYISIIQSETNLSIMVINAIEDNLDFISKKGKGHGYGLTIIESIAEKYGGNFSIDCYNNRVLAQVTLENIC